MPARFPTPATRHAIAITLIAGLALSAAAGPADDAQPLLPDPPEPDPVLVVPTHLDTRWVQHDGAGDQPQVIYETTLIVPGAAYVRFFLGDASLAGDLELGRGAFIRLTSLHDGGQQILSARHLPNWQNSTAYFRGDAVRFELVAHPDTGPSRVTVTSAIAGVGAIGLDTICGPTDDRVPTTDRRTGRWDWGCTLWLFDDRNYMVSTAGHCEPSPSSLAWFNVPLSTSSGASVPPPPEDQYPIDPSSRQSEWSGVGADWCYVGMLPNSTTGLMPVQGQGEWFQIATAAPPVAGQEIRITGHGTTDSRAPREWNRALKTHTGPYFSFEGTALRYRTDTTGGNSGSAVQDETTGLAIGVHTHGGCTSSGTGANAGTAIDRSSWQNALASPRGTAAYGGANVAPPLYVSSDVINLMGTLDRDTGAFGAIGYVPPDIRGLAWDAGARRLIGVDGAMRLWQIDPATGESEEGALVTGPSELINGLAMDSGGTLYGISAATGQVHAIDTSSGEATPIGAAAGGSMAGLAFNGDDGMLYATDDGPGATRLIRIDPATGDVEIVGTLGAGATDCDGLAWSADDGMLYTLDEATSHVLRVDPATGQATAVGSTGSPFAVDFGLACITDSCRADLNGDGVLDFFDFLEFQNLFAAGDLRADFTGDGVLDFFDFLAFQEEFAAGCD